MKCPNCGAETKGNVCEYCGSEILTETKTGVCCSKCGSANVVFRRENQGEIRGKQSKQIVHKTVGYCKDCGNTWFVSEDGTKKRKTWLWVLGWIFIFPLPLTILLLRNKKMKPVLKYGLIAAAWIIYLIIALAGRSPDNGRSATRTPAQDNTPTDTIMSNLTELSFTRTNDVTIKVGGSYSAGFVKASVKRSSEFSSSDVLFVSEDPDVATISLTEAALSTYLYYEITAIGPGETNVYAMSLDGSVVSEKIHVTVLEPVQVESITFNDVESELVLGEEIGLSVTIYPEEAEDKTITWASSDESVLQVDEKGNVQALGGGTATITATTNNGITSSIEFHVDGTKRNMSLRVSHVLQNEVNIGSEWSFITEVNGERASGVYTVSAGDTLRFYAKFTESDDNPDIGEASKSYTVTEKDLIDGFTVKMDLYVKENGGKNSGKSAHFVVSFSYTPK